MCTPQAFLQTPLITVRQTNPSRQTKLFPVCSAQPPSKPTRRVFLKHVVNCTTTAALLASERRTANAAAPEVSVPQNTAPSTPPQPRVKPKKVTWGYTAENGPEKWGLLSEDWALCSIGRSQSPVEFSYREAIPAVDTPRPTITTASVKHIVRLKEVSPTAANRSVIVEPYIPPPPPIIGDAPPVDIYTPPPPAAVVVLPNVGTYFLRSIHFHADASEHVIDGRRGSIEAHFVFEKRARAPPPPPPPQLSESEDAAAKSDSRGSSAVDADPSSGKDLKTKKKTPQESSRPGQREQFSDFAAPPANAESSEAPQRLVIAMTGRTSEVSDVWLDNVVNKAISAKEEARPALVELDLGKIIPSLQYSDFYQYNGSLTIPPGTEGVCWLVLGKTMIISSATLEVLVEMQGGPNVRPLQPLNERKVLRFPAISATQD